ncbi:MOSC domain-containing protein [Frigidibacter sp. RF13]|uniref:MOSC domain-containing protein n=1 Tax=Frigidibacter sp. RF13 TaxID=2997340 RepID=UPI00226E3BAD|nr:MOSC domain-containing protein [Frigidibacter sp. RF13]MCY1127436.1 MOSC domain-containing protein [Frigidibacter sp. RF13]
MTATVAALQRHPLKSHGREALASVVLTAGQGLPWDRRWAVAHEASKITEGEWAPCQNFSLVSKSPQLMAIDAQLEPVTGQLTLTHPDRPAITFRPDEPQDEDRFLEWVRPLVAANRAQPTRLYSVADRGMTDTDYPSVSLISLASNRALGAAMGTDLSPKRWRANIWAEGLEPFLEPDLVGRRLRVGEVLLDVVEPIERCLATTTNPETGVRDADTLAALRARFGHQNFGLYARVIEGGTIREGDQIAVLP